MNMKPIMNKKGLFALVCALMGMTFSMLTSCSDDLDVQQSYPFKVETMPVPKRIVKGETVEIRCELKREGRFSDARYTIRYFQPDGEGKLRMDDGMVLLPNDRYPLDREVFRLYYTSCLLYTSTTRSVWTSSTAVIPTCCNTAVWCSTIPTRTSACRTLSLIHI